MKKSFGTLNQLKTAVKNRINELEDVNPVEFSEDIDHAVPVEASENISLRQCKADKEALKDEYEVCDYIDCVTC